MKLNHKVLVNLLDFIKSGKFDFIKLDQTKEWIINNFPDPDGLAAMPETYEHPIWQYGNIEFHFTDNQLSLIYSDYIDTLDGGKSLELDKWICAEPQKLTLAYVAARLNQQRISFTTKHQTRGDVSGAYLKILESGVKLGFAPAENGDETLAKLLERHRNEDSNSFKLYSFSLSL
jgi:hypothetical protein